MRISLHVTERHVDLLCTFAPLKSFAFTIDTRWITFAPFSKRLAKGFGWNNMLSFKTMGSCVVADRHISARSVIHVLVTVKR